ncbi:unnamed protein product, partial [Strongylus vulgaris]
MDEDKMCKWQNVSLASYANALTMNEDAEEVDLVMLKAYLQRAFNEICREFNLTNESTSSQSELAIINARPSKYLNGIRLKWNVRKFRNDLTNLFLYNKIDVPFYSTFEKELFDDEVDIDEFAQTTAVFPKRCEAEDMIVEAQYCPIYDKSTMEGDVYAISHTGQMMEKSKVFLLYDVPNYVLVNGEDVIPIEFDSCKAMNGTSFLCTEKAKSHCDVTAINSCNIYAESTASNFYRARSYGNAVIVATNLPEVKIDGVAINVVSPVFTYHTSQYIEKDEDDQPLIMQSSRTSPATMKVVNL